MTRKEAIGHIKDVICENNTIKPNIVVFEQEKEALYMAIEALEQEQDILFKIFCIVDPLSIMSTSELEHKAIMQIAEMLEPICLPESEE